MARTAFSRQFRASAAALLIGIIAWAVMQSARASAGGPLEQVAFVRAHLLLFQLDQVVGALLTIPSVLVVWLMVEEKRREGKAGLGDVLGVASLVGYLLLIHVAYASQYLLWPRLVESWSDAELVGVYVEQPGSIPWLLKLLGYTFFSLAAVTVGAPWTKLRGYSRWVSGFLFTAGVVGLWGWVETWLGLPTAGIGLAVSGLLMVPYCIAILITERRPKHVQRERPLDASLVEGI